jgi:hypothetical protein
VPQASRNETLLFIWWTAAVVLFNLLRILPAHGSSGATLVVNNPESRRRFDGAHIDASSMKISNDRAAPDY